MAKITVKSTEKISLFPILLVNFIGTLGFSIVIPFLVILVTNFGGNALVYGLIAATYSAFQLVGAPILGRWSDKYGRKKILLLSQIGTLVAWMIFIVALFTPITTLMNVNSELVGAFAITIPLLILFVARALDGITGGNVSVANAYLADVTTEKERSKNFGRMAVSSNLGFIIGPALAGILGATILGVKLPVIAALVISLIAVLLIMFKLPESKPCIIDKKLEKASARHLLGQDQKECYDIKDSDKIKLKQIMKLENVPYILMLYFLIFLGFNIFYTAFPIHAIQGLNWSIAELGIFFSVLSLVMVIVQGPILSRLTKKFSDGFLAVLGTVILGTNFILLLSSNGIMIYLAAVLFALGNGLMWPSFLSILSKIAGEKHQGAVQGYGSSAGSLASIFGLILGGILYTIIGVFTFIVSAVVMYIVFILSFRLLTIEKS